MEAIAIDRRESRRFSSARECRPAAKRGRARAAITVLATIAATLLALLGASAARAESSPPAALPPATYPATFSEQRFIRMDDGVELGATITYPSVDGTAPAPGRFPVVLNMTPYGRDERVRV